VLPLSIQEFSEQANQLVYGSYPGIVRSKQKSILLAELYKNYIKKDIIEILKIGKADVMERLIALLAHSSGQLVNYQQLATDTKLAVLTVQNYLDVLENTYVVKKIKPYVGNKRKEVTANPVYYFVDNGFRNQALANFQGIEERLDAGLLAEGYVFQELYKFETQTRKQLNIHYWRTRSGAEVDFVLDLANQYPLPIEVKFQNFKQAKVSRAFRSFVEAYQPKLGFIVTKDFNAELDVESCTVKFISIKRLAFLFKSLPV
jgi:predicted AAA+ superfamily ATPase